MHSTRDFTKTALLVMGAVFTVCAVTALAHTVSLGAPSMIAWTPSVAATSAAGFGTTAAIFFALYQHFTALEDARSERKLNAARRGIEQAWHVLDREQPTRNMAWVNAARLILRSRNLANELTNQDHKKEWALFVEEWKIRILPFLSASHEYYFGYGDFSPFESDTDISEKDIHSIAESSAQEKSLSIGGYSSTLFADTILNERAIRTVYLFTRIYDQNDDPIKKETQFSDQEIEEVSNSHLNGLFSFLKIRRDYYFFGAEVKKRANLNDVTDK
jgi:hypothetical protein